MLTLLRGGTVYDPIQGIKGETRDIWIRDGRIVADPGADARPDETHDLSGKVVMAGGVDMHTHVGGGKVNIARTLLPPELRAEAEDSLRGPVPTAWETGIEYARMGYTAVFEPALLPVNARLAHQEMGDIPIMDKGAFAMLGNDDFLLKLLAADAPQAQINDYVSWILRATRSMAIKVVNPGGINAFKFNQRKMDLDETNPHYGVTARRILETLSAAVQELGVPKPLHVHTYNLGIPGNVDTTLATMAATGGIPVHLTHLQFHSYGTEGDMGFSSAAAPIAEYINSHDNISVDVGQVMFGQTCTISADTMLQYAAHQHANPKRWLAADLECEAGCGVVPFKYRDKSFVNALQWSIGLELFLAVNDPWRVVLTTDHPNGASFTSYPHLIRLLMDRSFRNDRLSSLHVEAQASTHLASMEREYDLYEIAIVTRAAPARLLGLTERGNLAPGSAADIAVYTPGDDWEAVFRDASLVFKDGKLVVRDGKLVDISWGVTHWMETEHDAGIETALDEHFRKHYAMSLSNYPVRDDDIEADGRGKLVAHACRRER